MKTTVKYLGDTDEMEFTYDEGQGRVPTTFKVDRAYIEAFATAAGAAAAHGGITDPWQLTIAVEDVADKPVIR